MTTAIIALAIALMFIGAATIGVALGSLAYRAWVWWADR